MMDNATLVIQLATHAMVLHPTIVSVAAQT